MKHLQTTTLSLLLLGSVSFSQGFNPGLEHLSTGTADPISTAAAAGNCAAWEPSESAENSDGIGVVMQTEGIDDSRDPLVLSATHTVPASVQSVGTNYCVSVPNSTGAASVISATATVNSQGEAVLSANDLVLSANSVPAGQPGMFFYGPTQAQFAFGAGYLCIRGGLYRLSAIQADASGVLTYPLDVTNPPDPCGTILSGSTWNFQATYRDPFVGGSTWNFSDGLEVTFIL